MTLSKLETWAMVLSERQRLIDDLAPVTALHWDTASLCRGWSVHDVLAHLVDTAKMGKLAFVWSMVRAKGNFDRANQDGVDRCKREDPQQTLAAFYEVRELRKSPPADRATRLVEAIVHGEDIRRPLGIVGEYPAAGVHEAIAYQLRTPVSFGGSRERAAGCRLIDAETGSQWGEGAEVRGRAIDLLLAATGREVSPGLLAGPGAHRLIGAEQSKNDVTDAE